jgi:hypothetical protein
LAEGFDDADVFVDGPACGADFDGSWVHGDNYHDESLWIKKKISAIRGEF